MTFVSGYLYPWVLLLSSSEGTVPAYVWATYPIRTSGAVFYKEPLKYSCKICPSIVTIITIIASLTVLNLFVLSLCVKTIHISASESRLN
jgi:hypothetical protein